MFICLISDRTISNPCTGKVLSCLASAWKKIWIVFYQINVNKNCSQVMQCCWLLRGFEKRSFEFFPKHGNKSVEAPVLKTFATLLACSNLIGSNRPVSPFFHLLTLPGTPYRPWGFWCPWCSDEVINYLFFAQRKKQTLE
jgi:hypothetical protein